MTDIPRDHITATFVLHGKECCRWDIVVADIGFGFTGVIGLFLLYLL